MKTLKKISICILFSLAVFACVEKDCFLFFDKPICTIENTSTEDKSENSLTSNNNICEIDVAVPSGIYAFDIKNLPTEKVIVSNSFYSHNIDFCIWQPPKIS